MNKSRLPLLFTLWLALALATVPALFAQETPPAPTVPERSAEAPAEPAAAAADEADDSEQPAEQAKETTEPEMRELAPGTEQQPAGKSSRRSRRSRTMGYDSNSDRPPFGSHIVPAGQSWREAVSVFGDTRVDGTVRDAAVSVLGSTTVNGTVNGEAVSVFGTTTINGKVGGVAVAVFGDVVLGPNADIGDEVVVVFGRLTRDAESITRGGVQEIGGFGPFKNHDWLRAWITKCLLWGRPLWVGENLGWAWLVAAGFLIFYMLLALIFPRGVVKCAETLEERPGNTILAALLTALLSPVLIVLLAITGIGIALIPFVGAAMFFGALFGKVAVFAWFGRRLAGQTENSGLRHPVVAVMIGGLIVAVLYMIPFLGFILWKMFGILGLGMVVYALILSTRREKPAPVAAAAVPAMVAPLAPSAVTAVPVAEPPVAGPSFAAAPTSLPPVLSAATLPRAGFWIRLAAALLDFLIIGISTAMLDSIFNFRGTGFIFFAIAAYCVVMWKTKGTTIGGVICGLKVVRLDDRPIDWGVAIVRALTAFLSFCVAGLGFIWVAFDDEKQSWHDKVAGTTIVRVPKGTPLL